MLMQQEARRGGQKRGKERRREVGRGREKGENRLGGLLRKLLNKKPRRHTKAWAASACYRLLVPSAVALSPTRSNHD